MPRSKTVVDETAEATKPKRGKTKVLAQEPATPREVRAFLLENSASLPEGVTVAARGRISAAAREHFTTATGRSIVE